jgi:thiosulfate/3-mercaptopyruvate sulfurtransferase
MAHAYALSENIVESVTANWLQDRLDDKCMRIVDVREAGFFEGHVPGALALPFEKELLRVRSHAPAGGRPRGERAETPALASPLEFAWIMSRVGIGDEHFVIAYDDLSGEVSRRFCRALYRYGHAHCAYLQGGFMAWRTSGGAIERTRVHYPPASFTARAS